MRIYVRHQDDDPEYEPQEYDVTMLEISTPVKLVEGDYGGIRFQEAEADEHESS